MPPIAKQEELKLKTGEDAIKEIIDSFALSDDNKDRVKCYYDLAIRQTISEEDADRVELLWKIASNDERLAEALGLIDDMHPPCLVGEDLVANDRAFRAHLSECLPLIAEEKLKLRKCELEELESGEGADSCTPTKTLFCPDGSGMINVPLPESNLFEINASEKCPRCDRKLGDHRQANSDSEVSCTRS